MSPPARKTRPSLAKRAFATACLACLVGCGSPAPAGEDIKIALMLSYTGYLAANSINSERALLLAVDSANAIGGIRDRKLRVMARDTFSTAARSNQVGRELADAGAAVFIGPDTVDLATPLRSALSDRTIILPSYATSSDLGFGSRSPNTFVMGVAASRVACELMAQVAADGRQKPLLIANPNGYGSTLTWEITNKHTLPKHVLPIDQASTAANVQPIVDIDADAYVLAAFPTSASSLIYALSALGALKEPSRWYLSPTLHTPVFLQFIPHGALDGAHGVAPGTVAGAAAFRSLFASRWQDDPLDEAFAFYDAGMIASLSLARALVRTAEIPTGTGLSEHIRAVTASGGMPVAWNEFAHGLELLERGEEIEYVGLSGPLEFDSTGQTPEARTKWWTIGPDGFSDIPERSDCK
jgi:ABC-type branched-subunit amino acid transport system substrate-binding protein